MTPKLSVSDAGSIPASSIRKTLFFSLAAFAKFMTEGKFVMRPHNKCIIDLFEAAMAKRYRNILIHCPPGAGKSFLSQLNVAWAFYRNPDARVIVASYGLSLSQTFGRNIRNYLESPQYKAIAHPRGLLQKGGGDSKFYTAGDGTFLATSVGGATTGFRAGAWDDKASPGWLVIDDPLKGSNSQAAIDEMHLWYAEQAGRRVLANHVIAIIATRFHLDDLHGRRIAQDGLVEEGGLWKMLRIAALCDDPENDPLGRQEGESFWPDNPIYSVENLLAIKRNEPEVFYALYQGTPVQRGGALIRQEWIIRWPTEQRAYSARYLALDTAFEDSQTADYSVITAFGVFDSKLFVLGQTAGKWIFPELLEQTRLAISQYRVERVCIEAKASGISLAQTLGKTVNVPITKLKSAQSKRARAQLILPLLTEGRVILPSENYEWVEALIHELTTFPYSRYDDRFDSFVWGLLYFLEHYSTPRRLVWRPHASPANSRLHWS